MNRLRITGRLIIISLLLLASFPGLGEPQAASSPARTLTITRWLMAGPFPSPQPAFNDSKVRIFGLNDLLPPDESDGQTQFPGGLYGPVYHHGRGMVAAHRINCNPHRFPPHNRCPPAPYAVCLGTPGPSLAP